jgi:hypothetical protein
VDVLLTSQFPQGVDVGALPLPFSGGGGGSSSSTLVTHVVSALCPRYHFASFSNVAYVSSRSAP